MLDNWSQIQGATVQIVGALLTLVIGWFIVRIFVSRIKKFLEKNRFINDKVLSKFEKPGKPVLADIISRVIYYVLMLVVVISVFEVLGLSIITQPFNNILNTVFAYLPKLLGAAILLLVAWAVATLLKKVVLIAFDKTKIDEKVDDELPSTIEKVKFSTTIAEMLYWAVFILFLPAILSALSLDGLLAPIQNMVNVFLGFVPNLFSAAVVILIGWFIARLVRNIVTNFLKSLNVDSFGKTTGLTVEDKGKTLSELIGTVVYVIILIPVIISGLNILGLESISMPATDMLSKIFAFLPVLFSAFIIVAFAYFIGKMVGDLVTNILSKLGVDRVLPLVGIKESKINLSHLVGKLVLIAIVLFSALEAANIIGFSRLSGLIEQFILLAGNILTGVLIVGIGLYVANLVSDLIRSSGTGNASVLALIAKVSIIILATTMGLNQMGLATTIINSAFIFFVGAIAVAFAIAFGIGGRDLAARKLDEMEDKMKKKDDVVR